MTHFKFTILEKPNESEGNSLSVEVRATDEWLDEERLLTFKKTVSTLLECFGWEWEYTHGEGCWSQVFDALEAVRTGINYAGSLVRVTQIK